eukprot:Hpha_TRINITY_DN16897_c1_g3::TRINITY_DN16897_c1_g3_i1::g.150695::m.150695
MLHDTTGVSITRDGLLSFGPGVTASDMFVRTVHVWAGAQCTTYIGVHRFGEPLILPIPDVKVGKGRRFEHVFRPSVYAQVGGVGCSDPILRLGVSPPGVSLFELENGYFSLNGTVENAGRHPMEVEAVDCKGGVSGVTVGLYVVEGTEFDPLTSPIYVEDSPGTFPVPDFVSSVSDMRL